MEEWGRRRIGEKMKKEKPGLAEGEVGSIESIEYPSSGALLPEDVEWMEGRFPLVPPMVSALLEENVKRTVWKYLSCVAPSSGQAPLLAGAIKK